MKKLFLIDTSNLICRAFYAMSELKTSSGTPTGGLYGFVSLILRLIRKEKPDYICACMDSKGGSFRKGLSNTYKANRKGMPPELGCQFDFVREFLNIIGIVQCGKEGFEADDVIGSMAEKFKGENVQVYLVSSDKDLYQLVDDNVFVYDGMKNIIIGRQEVFNKFGVPPEQVVEVMSFTGDAVDNITGVKGVGPKTALKLIRSFGTVEEVIKQSSHIIGTIGDKIRRGIDDLKVSKKLVTIHRGVPLDMTLEDLKLNIKNTAELREFFDRFEFANIKG